MLQLSTYNAGSDRRVGKYMASHIMSVLRSQTGLKPLSTPTCSFTLDMYLKTWDCECVELYRVCVRQRQVRLIAVARQNVTLSDNHIFNILLNFTGEERTGS